LPVIETIAPIFLIILFGNIVQRKGFLKPEFVQEANRFVFYLSLPFLIFAAIVKSDLKDIAGAPILSVALPTLVMVGISLGIGLLAGLRGGRLGTFSQTTFHGNVTYIGLAVLYYMLGEEALKKGSIIIGFLILVNNVMAIAVLSWASHQHKNLVKSFLSILKTPVIIATFAGMLVLYTHIPVPGVVQKSMVILGNIALPMALFVIGASMSLKTLRVSLKPSIAIAVLKLALLPYLSVLFCKLFCLSPSDSLPGVLLLATPTALTSYILAHQLGGDTDLASGAVTLSTLLSPIAFVFWVYFLR
jgi:predicted permease